ncbi:uncharacterized protein LTR77_008043 [Saxophila tyrrhenica]|uniref:DUF1996 domain-containing protein n=1 Tax=Saxophila tyrrhenica TaxID=1690608 RepID=A0AAV9P1M9_9PEZI|nr:hypothetical protein LTR77_008043 [Saxophila tyrrhenica]
MKTSQAILTSAIAFSGIASAFWRMPCRSQTGVARLDPLVDPGEISAHVHTITGGGGFSWDATFETLTADGSCTACEVTQDHSAYWTPTLNFAYDNGTTVMVPQVGGMLVYYLYYLDKVKAFPEGFQMLAGNQAVRNFTGPFPDTELSHWPTDATDDQFFLQQRALGFNCLNYDIDPEPSLYRHTMPSQEYLDAHCKDGIRLELAFPSCGNGSLDSTDHKSHMAYPSLVKEGNCPDGYDEHYPFLFYETIWATNAFAGESGQFVLSYGDPVGTGYHGDFIMGWESEEFLQDALDTCKSPSGDIEDCPLFKMQSDSDAAKCTFDVPDCLKEDNPKGPRQGLAVDVPVQYGPEEATAYAVAGRKGHETQGIAPSQAPETFSQPTLTYSPADPESTKTAQGGIVVAMATTKSDSDQMKHGAVNPVGFESPATTSSPAEPSPPAQPEETPVSYITNGNTVVELFVTEVDVTVTATETASADSYHKRHLHRHAHHHHGR